MDHACVNEDVIYTRASCMLDSPEPSLLADATVPKSLALAKIEVIYDTEHTPSSATNILQ